MSGENKIPPKRSHKENGSAFPDDLEIPESVLHDRKFLSSYVYIFNDPRVYKRQRLNGDRTSSRFDVDYNCHINVVYNEPVIKRKSILTSTQSPKEKNPDDSGIRKSVSFLSKITFIDAIELDGGSSDWTDIEVDESEVKSKMKSKTKKDTKIKNNVKKGGTSNGIPSNKSHKKKAKDKSASKKGNKVKSPPKELFKFKITKPFRKFGRSKERKQKHLQKKFGRRMFKAFVHVKRSFNLKHIPDQVSVPLEKITMNENDVSTPKRSAPSIQDFLIGQMTKKVKVCITPVHADDTNEEKINNTEIIQNERIESNTSNDLFIHNSINTENEVQSDSQVDSNGTKESAEDNQNNAEVPSTESLTSDQTTKINGDMVPALSNDSPDMVI